MDRETRVFVRRRAGETCEYCQLPQAQSPLARLQIEHIVPKKHGGGNELGNLALACLHCNLQKGANLAGIDPESGDLVPLFNPRSQSWMAHFAWSGCTIVGRTAVGRTTVRVLNINSKDRIRVRMAGGDPEGG